MNVIKQQAMYALLYVSIAILLICEKHAMVELFH